MYNDDVDDIKDEILDKKINPKTNDNIVLYKYIRINGYNYNC